MKAPTRLNPVPVKIRVLWMTQARALAKKERVAAAIEKIRSDWMEIAEFKFEDHAQLDPQMAEEELLLDAHIGKVKVYDWCWLIETFEADQLADLQLAICEECFPDKRWEIVENDRHSVVTDFARLLVCDLSLGDKLSAATCLALAGDQTFLGQEEVLKELEAYEADQLAIEQGRLVKLEKAIAQLNGAGEVHELRPES